MFAWGKGDEGQLGDCRFVCRQRAQQKFDWSTPHEKVRDRDVVARGCSSSVPVRAHMSEGLDGDGESSDDDRDDHAQDWEGGTAASDEENEGCDRVTSCYAAGHHGARICEVASFVSVTSKMCSVGNMTILTTRAGLCYTCGDGCSGQQALPLDRCKTPPQPRFFIINPHLARSGRRYVLQPHVIIGLPPLLAVGAGSCCVACGGAHVVVAVQAAGDGEQTRSQSFF